MVKAMRRLVEGFSFAGTYLYSVKSDAEGVASMLGLSGAFPIHTDEGDFWMPGNNYDQLMNRIYASWTVPDQATVPQTHSQPVLPFLAYLEKT